MPAAPACDDAQAVRRCSPETSELHLHFTCHPTQKLEIDNQEARADPGGPWVAGSALSNEDQPPSCEMDTDGRFGTFSGMGRTSARVDIAYGLLAYGGNEAWGASGPPGPGALEVVDL